MMLRLLILLALLWPGAGWGAWSDTTRKSSAGVVNTTVVQPNHTGAVSGNFMVCGASTWHSAAAPTTFSVSDTQNGAWTQAGYVTNGVQGVGIYYKANTFTGTLNITGTASGSANDLFLACHEFSGQDATQPDGTLASNTGSSTTASTGSTTPAYQDSLLIAMMGVDDAGAITENAGSQGFTLSNENSSPGQPGSLVFKIVTGNPGSPSESWTNGNATWAAMIQAFRASGAAAVGGGPTLHALPLMGVGQ